MKKTKNTVVDLQKLINTEVAKLSDYTGTFYDTVVSVKKTKFRKLKVWFNHLLNK